MAVLVLLMRFGCNSSWLLIFVFVHFLLLLLWLSDRVFQDLFRCIRCCVHLFGQRNGLTFFLLPVFFASFECDTEIFIWCFLCFFFVARFLLTSLSVFACLIVATNIFDIVAQSNQQNFFHFLFNFLWLFCVFFRASPFSFSVQLFFCRFNFLLYRLSISVQIDSRGRFHWLFNSSLPVTLVK